MTVTISKYKTSGCVKCKVLDRTLKGMNLGEDVTVIEHVVDDDMVEVLESKGITSLPALEISSGDKKTLLSGILSPKQITDAIESVSA